MLSIIVAFFCGLFIHNVAVFFLVNGRKRYNNLNHWILHLPSSLDASSSLWMNFGLWTSSDSFTDACEALALACAEAAHIESAQSIIDVGFGCGDQLLLWQKKYPNLDEVFAFNNSSVQVKAASERLKEASSALKMNRPNFVLFCADVMSVCPFNGETAAIPPPQHSLPEAVDAVVAVDSLYHIHSRTDFFKMMPLRSGGHFSCSDLLLLPTFCSARPWLAWIISKLAGISISANPWDVDDYEAALVHAGFEDIEIEDITDRSLVPFSKFAHSHIAALSKRSVFQSVSLLPFILVAKALSYLTVSNQFAKYILVKARKK